MAETGTDWFAVDRDGHLAHLASGVSGAIPGGAGQGAGSFDAILAPLARAAPVTESVYELEGRLLPGLEAAGDDLHAAAAARGPVTVFLPNIELVEAEMASGLAVPVRASFGAAALFDRLPRASAQRLHGQGGCLGCFAEPEEDRVDPSRFGLFSYRHLCDSWIAGPYGRRARPAASLLVHQLPSDLRARFTAFRFERICFADAPHLQPLDHFRCHATPPAYLDVDGKSVRPIRGRELEYRQFFFPRHRRDPRFLVERPPD